MTQTKVVKIIGLVGGLGAGVTPAVASLPCHNTTAVINIPAAGMSTLDGLPAETLYRIGRKYQLGQGVTINPAMAYRFYYLAAVRGLAKAQYALGLLFANDEVTTVTVADPVNHALHWLGRAANQGHRHARNLYNHLLKTDDFYLGC